MSMAPTSTDERRPRGARAESLVAAALELAGYEILGRNVRAAGVEIDVVARQDALLVLVEVKLRGSRSVGAERPIGWRQVRRQRRAAAALLASASWAASVRHDLVVVEWSEGEIRLRHWRAAEAGGWTSAGARSGR